MSPPLNLDHLEMAKLQARLRREREKKLRMMIFLAFVLHMRKRLATAGTNPIPKPITSTVSQRSR
jgi:hypothetical protein